MRRLGCEVIAWLGIQTGFQPKLNNVLWPLWGSNRPVALMARAPDSKSGGWGFESLLACIEFGWVKVIIDDS